MQNKNALIFLGVFLLSVSMISIASADVTTDMLAFYEFEEANVALLIDSHNGYSHTTVIGSHCSSITGKVGNGAYCDSDATNDYTALNHVALINLLNGEDYTVGGWINKPARSCTGFGCAMFSVANFEGGPTFEVAFVEADLKITITDEYLTETYLTATITEDWHYFTITKDGVNSILYIDGVQVDTGTGDYAYISGGGGAPKFYQGVYTQGSEETTYDEWVFYSRTLNSTDVGELYNTTNAGYAYEDYGTWGPCTPVENPECGDNCGEDAGDCDSGYSCSSNICTVIEGGVRNVGSGGSSTTPVEEVVDTNLLTQQSAFSSGAKGIGFFNGINNFFKALWKGLTFWRN